MSQLVTSLPIVGQCKLTNAYTHARLDFFSTYCQNRWCARSVLRTCWFQHGNKVRKRVEEFKQLEEEEEKKEKERIKELISSLSRQEKAAAAGCRRYGGFRDCVYWNRWHRNNYLWMGWEVETSQSEMSFSFARLLPYFFASYWLYTPAHSHLFWPHSFSDFLSFNLPS